MHLRLQLGKLRSQLQKPMHPMPISLGLWSLNRNVLSAFLNHDSLDYRHYLWSRGSRCHHSCSRRLLQIQTEDQTEPKQTEKRKSSRHHNKLISICIQRNYCSIFYTKYTMKIAVNNPEFLTTFLKLSYSCFTIQSVSFQNEDIELSHVRIPVYSSKRKNFLMDFIQKKLLILRFFNSSFPFLLCQKYIFRNVLLILYAKSINIKQFFHNLSFPFL